MINVAEKEKCCGCGACSDICPKGAIDMVPDEKGFLYPVVNKEKCVSCDLCEKVCAFGSEHNSDNNIKNIFALQTNDDIALKESSSGGAFTALSNYVIGSGGYVFGAVLEPETFDVHHVCASSLNERNSMRESKYIQSATTGIFNEVKEKLREGKLVLFTGTPCQCAQLERFLNGSPDNLIIVDLLCHGVPSDKVFRDHIKYWEEKEGKKAVRYRFRSKKYGYEYNHEIIFEDGTRNTSIQLKNLLKVFEKNMRDSCYACPYASTHRYGDITIGDLWECGEKAGIFDHKGTSTVIINTQKGEEFFEKAVNECSFKEITIDFSRVMALSHPVKKTNNVDKFWEDYFNKGYEFTLGKYGKLSLKSYCYQRILRILHFLHLNRICTRL